MAHISILPDYGHRAERAPRWRRRPTYAGRFWFGYFGFLVASSGLLLWLATR